MQYDDHSYQQYDDPYAGDDYHDAAGHYPEYAADPATRQWAMVLHLSQFAAVIVPVAGILAPLLIWQIKRDALPGIDLHGRIVANWMLSALIYTVVSVMLLIVAIGIPLLMLLGLLLVVFPIVGAIKASDGIAWHYPLSIRFF